MALQQGFVGELLRLALVIRSAASLIARVDGFGRTCTFDPPRRALLLPE
jgi:hypothetical protein